MEKRIHKKSGNHLSLLGFGLMRLPVTEDNNKIDYDKAQKMIDYAYTHGVNYFDTAYMYHGGFSEFFAGEALSKYPRSSYFLADKLPGWEVKDGGVPRAREIFEDQLKKCKTDYFDYYLCHSLQDKDSFDRIFIQDGVLTYLQNEKAQGRIRNLGFSFHGNVAFFRYLIELCQWDFCQIQLNYLDWDNQDAKTLYRIAEENDVQLIIMEPVRGGSLVKLCDESVKILNNARSDWSTASWALRFVASLPNVMCVLSGMSDLSQVEDNIGTMTDFHALTEDDHIAIAQAVSAYNKTGTVPCTACRYCFECPKKIMIPEIFDVYNTAAAENRLPMSLGLTEEDQKERREAFLAAYDTIPEENQAHHCIHCGKCETHCPQTIEIPRKLRNIARIVESIR